MCVLHVLGCSKQTRCFPKNTREGGYPSNQDTRERKQKKYEKEGGGEYVCGDSGVIRGKDSADMSLGVRLSGLPDGLCSECTVSHSDLTKSSVEVLCFALAHKINQPGAQDASSCKIYIHHVYLLCC